MRTLVLLYGILIDKDLSDQILEILPNSNFISDRSFFVVYVVFVEKDTQ